MKDERRKCGNCRFHKYDSKIDLWFCENPESEWYTDWTEYNYECDDFEDRKDGTK